MPNVKTSLLTLALAQTTSAYVRGASNMNCGSDVHLCGVLALETGAGPGNYAAKEPCVHGLWPEVDPYGTSECIAVSDNTSPSKLSTCYNNGTNDDSDQLSFEVHEWTKHGTCSGAKDSDDFFGQVCAMADPPLAVMTKSKDAGDDLAATSNAVEGAGYEVFYVDTQYSQLYLSACAGPDKQWKLSSVADFSKNCGGWSGDDEEGGDEGGDDTNASCPTGEHGPVCTSDKDCSGVTDCVRCASSGYCTSATLTE